MSASQESAPVVAPTLRLPLEDVTILAVEQYGAGPWATLQLADLGARVIKIEDPAQGGDVGRYVPPYQSGEDSLFFEAFNRGKESVSLDLRSEHGARVLRDLAAGADALFCNLRGDLPDRLGLTYAHLRSANPRIVCCSLSGYGRTGPDAAIGAYDYVIQARAGWMSLTGSPDGPPTRAGLSLVDFSGGYVAALAILGGLVGARAGGEGCDCDVSLFETALSLTNYMSTWTASTDYEPVRHADSAHPSIVPFQQFRTSNGWVVLACPKEKFWRRLCDALDAPSLLDDPRTVDFAARHAHRDWVLRELRRLIVRFDTDDLLARLRDAGVPSSRVNGLREALADEQAVARGGVTTYAHATLGQVRTPTSPLRVGAAPRPAAPAPVRGGQTDEILAELCGYDQEAIEGLRRAGVLG